jgi:RNA ligase (TIGR02306 family)
MVRKLATIQRISRLEAIPNSDNLEVASILGWKCVVKKGEFKEGDTCVYFEVDSLLPIRPEFEFLRKTCHKTTDFGEGFRIKTIRLRGQVSQGLAWNTNILTEKHEEGFDVSEELGVKQYSPPIPACLKGKVKGHMPSFIQKTDETRVQLLQDVLTRHKGKDCYVTSPNRDLISVFLSHKICASEESLIG